MMEDEEKKELEMREDNYNEFGKNRIYLNGAVMMNKKDY